MQPAIYLEAEFDDGFVRTQDVYDASEFVEGKNVFHDLLEGLHVPAHGAMRRFTLVTPLNKFDIDWAKLPKSARPIRYFKMANTFGGNGDVQVQCLGIGFGYQFTTHDGRNVQTHIKMTPEGEVLPDDAWSDE